MQKNSPSFFIYSFILYLAKWKKAIIINFLVIFIIAVIYAFFFAKKYYRSSITFLPPKNQPQIATMFQTLNIPINLSFDISAEQIITIFTSKSFRRNIIDNFNLYERFKLKKNTKNRFEKCLKKLDKLLKISTEDVGVMGYSNIISFSISYEDTKADSAYMIINYVYKLLDSAVQNISIDNAQRYRIFTEMQLAKQRAVLDSLQKKMVAFQKDNKIIDVSVQAKLALESASEIKSEIIKNEILIEALMQRLNSEHPEIQKIRNKNLVLKKKLEEIEYTDMPDILPGLIRATELRPVYLNYLLDIEVQTKVILFLSQQLEMNRLEESKTISRLKIVDNAFIPEYKCRPKRILLVALIVFVELILFFLLFFYRYCYITLWRHNDKLISLVKAFSPSRKV